MNNATLVFTSRSARSARTAGTKIDLRFPRLFVCLFVCLSVCASALITCAKDYVIRYYATAVYSSFWRFAGQATANEGSFVLPRWRNVVGRKDPVLVAYSYYLEAHDETAESALSLYRSRNIVSLAPKL